MDDRLTIVGSGLAGTLLACYLGQAGRRVVLYEKRPDPRAGDAERGRSINLALSTRGLHALGEVGLADEVLRSSVVMRGRMIHHLDHSLTFQPYGKDDREVLHSVSRSGLNRLLVEAAARYPNVEMHFAHRCVYADLDRGELEFANGQRVVAPVVIGADGAFSVIRQAMQRRERFDYSQEYLSHGYKELSIAPGPNGACRMEPHALHIWPRGGFMLIALPNSDGSFTCTLFAAYEGANGLSSLREAKQVVTYFEQHFPDVVPLLPDLVDQFGRNPVGPLVTIRCQPWHLGGRAVLVGDACHAVVPFLGQGMNAAFEDCSVLVECLRRASGQRADEARGASRGSQSPRREPREEGGAAAPRVASACASGFDFLRDVEEVFGEYQVRRKPHLDTLARLCVDNFLEMRDHVGSRWFVLQKKLALYLHRLLPGWYLPLYTMVEFTRIPYADAVRRARRQDRIVLTLITVASLALVGGIVWLTWR